MCNEKYVFLFNDDDNEMLAFVRYAIFIWY